jgi:enoyl-CoA hydratase/carnithine racemase
MGMVSKVVPFEQLSAETAAVAGKMETQAPISLRYVKEAVNKGLDMTLEQGLRLEADLYLLLHTTKDRTEGITAFLAKRKADFKGE